jgi:hypothetical protein
MKDVIRTCFNDRAHARPQWNILASKDFLNAASKGDGRQKMLTGVAKNGVVIW